MNNVPKNLEWGTHGENERDKTRHGRTNHGEKNSRARLTGKQVLEIRGRWAAGGITQAALAEEYGVRFGHINLIVHGRRWQHLLPAEETMPHREEIMPPLAARATNEEGGSVCRPATPSYQAERSG